MRVAYFGGSTSKDTSTTRRTCSGYDPTEFSAASEIITNIKMLNYLGAAVKLLSGVCDAETSGVMSV